MKIFPILLALGCSVLIAGAQTETGSDPTNAPATTLQTNSQPPLAASTISTSTNHIEIESDRAELRTETNYTAIYVGNVQVRYGESTLSCEELTVRTEKGEEQPDYVLAERNVVITHKDRNDTPITAKGDRATYTYAIQEGATNQLIVLSGNAYIRFGEKSFVTGDVVIWDLIAGTAYIPGSAQGSRQRTVIDLGAKNPFNTRTNAPAANP